MIKILLVDDEQKIRQGWRMRLGLEPDFSIVGEADRGALAVALATATQPHVILLDLKLYGRDSTGLIERLRAAAPGSKVIVVTIYDDARRRAGALAAGAAAFVPKQESPERLLDAIRQAGG